MSYFQSLNNPVKISIRLGDRVLLIKDMSEGYRYCRIHVVTSIINGAYGKSYFLDNKNEFYKEVDESLLKVNSKMFGEFYKINKLSKDNYFIEDLYE